DLRPVGGGRHDDPASALDGLGNEGGHLVGTDLENFLFELPGCPQAELVLVHVAAFAVPVRPGDMHYAGNGQVALFVHRCHAAQAGAGHRGAVVAVDAANDGLAVWLALPIPVTP